MHWNIIFFVLSGKMVFLFPETLILFFRWKMKDDLSQKILGNMICLWNMIWYFFLLKILYYLSVRWSSPEKISFKMIFPVLLKKMILILKNMVFPLIKKLKIIKKFTFIKKLQWFFVISWRPLHVFSYFVFKWKKPGKLNIYD